MNEKPKKIPEKFDPVTMIHAGALRAAGFPIPENIPDCAWTYRDELNLNCMDAVSDEENGIVSVDVSIQCGAFHWVEGKVTSLPMKVDCD